jgi:two-component sensor histidine kinase
MPRSTVLCPRPRAKSAWNGRTQLTGELRLGWTETGGPPVQEPTRKGVGGRIIEGMITQLKGKARFDWRKDGLVCEITLRV